MIIKPYKILLCFIGSVLLLYSCKQKERQAVDAGYHLFNLEQSGWKSKSMLHHVAGLNYKATLVPLQYYILKQEEGKSEAVIDSIYREYANERIIELEFQHDTKADVLKNEYTHRNYDESVQYMAFHIKKDFKVITSVGDSIACSGVTFERNFKVAPFKRILLHFGNIPEGEPIQLQYTDNLFGNGDMTFEFKETPIVL